VRMMVIMCSAPCLLVVAADTGAIGGSLSHEFHIESAIGEDRLQVCPSCQSAVNTELLINSSGDWLFTVLSTGINMANRCA